VTVPRPLTPVQLAALSSSFAPEPYVTAAPYGSTSETRVPLIDGTVSYTAASTDRVSASIRVPLVDTDGTTWAPTEWSSLLTPDDVVIRAYYGLGVDAPVRVATLWLDDVLVVRPDGYVELSCVSGAQRVAQAGFPTGDRRYTGPTATVVRAIVESCLGHTVAFRDDGLGGPVIVDRQVFDGNPWDAVEQLCDAAGGEAFFDDDGVLVVRPTPKVQPAPGVTLSVGAGGTITGYRTRLTRSPNVVRMEFQNPTGGAGDVVGVAQATGHADPAGPYGPYRVTETRTGVVTQAQANAAAAEYLTRAGGILRSVELDAAPHPGIVVGDTLGVSFVNGATELHRVIAVELPLGPGDGMRVETRATPW
jgi:hypothetical protein